MRDILGQDSFYILSTVYDALYVWKLHAHLYNTIYQQLILLSHNSSSNWLMNIMSVYTMNIGKLEKKEKKVHVQIQHGSILANTK